MPTYDYRCVGCGREVEVMHGIHDSGPEACQTCGGVMRKALSPPAIHFKGSGWAKKDAAGAKKAAPKASSTADTGTSSDKAGSSSGETGTSGTSTESSSNSSAESTSKAATTAGSSND